MGLEGVWGGGEMTQTLYAHMNKRNTKKRIKDRNDSESE
jgi:hypothetical protein